MGEIVLTPELLWHLKDVAEDIATEAGDLAKKLRECHGPRTGRWQRGIETKSSPTDPVSMADRLVEGRIRDLLAQQRPGDAVLAEEGGGVRAAGELCWVVDPIDGTVNYLAGSPDYAVSIGVELDGEAVAGAVYAPVHGILWSAARGEGAWKREGGRRTALHDHNEGALSAATIATGFSYRDGLRVDQGALVAELIHRVGDIRRGGSAALDFCYVAEGIWDGYFEHGLDPGGWDYSAGRAIAEAAGKIVRVPPRRGTEDPDGLGATVMVVASHLHQEFANTLRLCGAGAIVPPPPEWPSPPPCTAGA